MPIKLPNTPPSTVIRVEEGTTVTEACFELGNKTFDFISFKIQICFVFLVRCLKEASVYLETMAKMTHRNQTENPALLQFSEEYAPVSKRVNCLEAALRVTLDDAKIYSIAIKRQGPVFDNTRDQMQTSLNEQSIASKKLK